MLCERLRSGGDPVALAASLRKLVPAPESVSDDVAAIIAAVAAEGDAAVRCFTQRFDVPRAELRRTVVEPAALERAERELGPELRQAIELAMENVGAVASGWLGDGPRPVRFGDHDVSLRHVPVARAAVYVPGGRAAYPSTVVMGVITARRAGVAEVAVCAPPRDDGEIDPAVLAACALTGATEVYRMGGAQAVAALAYGTEVVRAVQVIVGPGNLYVQEAKRQLSARVGIDGFAGPSDLLLLADEGSDPGPLSLDLQAQAEHGPGTLVAAASSSPALLDRLAEQLEPAPETGAVLRLIEVDGVEEALALSEAFAPEHLQLVGGESEGLAARITRAGCVFVGPGSATAFGDYIAGSNHILPTGGAARFASGVTPAHFQRSMAEVRIGDGSALARAAAPLARAEGFELHARSMEARIRDNPRR